MTGQATVTLYGPEDWIERLVTAINEVGGVDVEVPGGHGRNREHYPGLGARVVDGADGA